MFRSFEKGQWSNDMLKKMNQKWSFSEWWPLVFGLRIFLENSSNLFEPKFDLNRFSIFCSSH